ncbi:glucosyltransferase domain-containing protein [Mizugakiibacter sediminis]|uniref:glucosyltransferase domain-containing protein n=1 Tax=Mizugakiibacter sediminis TaxID=1475481 RepID=UPI0009E51836|nr:glucosyltransferase domain-containing protein [Mizugakiibacter sediminis]
MKNAQHLMFDRFSSDVALRQALLFAWVLLCVFLSKGSALLGGYALDDYKLSLGADSESTRQLAAHFLSQGRYTFVPITLALDAVGINFVQIQFLAAALCISAYAYFIATVFSYPLSLGTSFAACLIGSAVAASHPYAAEYFTFRQADLPMAIAWLLSALSLRLAARQFRQSTDEAIEKNSLRQRVLVSSLVLTLAAGINQLVVPATFCGLIGMFALPRHRSGHGDQFSYDGIRIAFLVPAFATIAYVIINLLLSRLFSLPHENRATLIGVADIPQRCIEVLSLLKRMVWDGEPILSHGAKIAFVAALLLSAGLAFIQNRYRTVLILACGVLMLAATIAPVAVGKSWWPVPRSISAYAIASGIVAAGLVGGALLSRSGAFVIWSFPLLALSFSSASVFFDQTRLNRWDQLRAALILHDVETHFGKNDSRPILIGNPSWGYPSGLGTTQGDMNISAFAKPWSISGLFTEATGTTRKVFIGDDINKACIGKPNWPTAGSLSERGDAILVCL